MDPRSPEVGRRPLFLELAVVLLVLWVPFFVTSLQSRPNPPPHTLESDVYLLCLDAGAIALILFLAWRNGESLRHFGLRRTRWWAELLWALLIYVTCWVAAAALFRVQSATGWRASAPASPPEPRSALYNGLLPFFLLVSAFFEELLFRGYLWDRLRRLTKRPWLALGVTATLFTAYHPYSGWQMLNVFAFGLVLGLFHWKGRSLPRLVLAHAAFNASILYPAGA
jgi:hypothetical protein